jgi:translation initiation factor IF-2
MSDTNDRDNTGAPRRPAGPRGPGIGPRGAPRSASGKVVVVEKKRRRALTGKDGKPVTTGAEAQKKELTAAQIAAKKLGLSEEEVLRRMKAIEKANAEKAGRDAERKIEDEARAQRAADDQRRLEEERSRQEEAARERAAALERATEAPQEELPVPIVRGEARPKPKAVKQEETAASPDEAMIAAARAEKGGRRERPNQHEEALEELGGRIKSKKSPSIAPVKATPRAKGEPEKRRHKLTIVSALDDEGGDRQRSLSALKRAREKERMRRESGASERDRPSREVIVPEVITVQELANRMAERSAAIVKYLMQQGQMVRAIDVIDADTAELIVEEFGHTVKRVSESDIETGFLSAADPDDRKIPRPPVVAVMGHVDHGKTSLLDALRSTDVASGEAGGITQHIGAYQVKLKTGEKITFLDTPGHAAFSAMRARGANVTDIVILVVAADDSVMPQTIEAINHAKAAGTPVIVAVNKVDKPDSNPEKVLQDLLRYEIVVEAMGGDTQAIFVSALKKTGLDELTDAINLQAEVLELNANPDRSAEGTVIESQLDKGRGPVATVLVERGTLKRGDLLVAGSAWGRVRALTNERGQQVGDATPSEPVEVLGLSEAPEPGEPFAVVENEARARELTDYRARQKRQKTGAATGGGASLEQMMSRLKDKEVAELPIVVKADVQGSAEAISQVVEKIGNEEVRARVIHSGVGGVSESDVLLAKSSGSPILAFNVRANKQAREMAEREGVEIRYYSIIYNLIDDIRDTLNGMLAPEKREDFIGYAEILEVFNITKVGKVAGCRISEGVVKRGCGVRLLRDDVVIHEGELSTLKRFKDEVTEVRSGMECGMGFANYHDLQKGDRIECFQVTEVKRELAKA